MDDPGFWTGAGATGLAAVGAAIANWVIGRGARREALEERLQRWQTETVARVHAENAELRDEVSALKERSDTLPIIVACLKMTVAELRQIAPGSPVLQQVGMMLSRVLPLDIEVPDDMLDIIARIDEADRERKRRRK